MNKTYYKLKDLLPTDWQNGGPFYPQGNSAVSTFLNLLYGDVGSADFSTKISETATLLKFFKEYLYPTVYDQDVIAACDQDDLESARKKLAVNIYVKIAETQPVYEKNIALLDANADELLKGSSTMIKFNDTPQDGGDFATDQHVTTATSSQTDAPIIERLEETRRILRNEYAAWLREFERMMVLGD